MIVSREYKHRGHKSGGDGFVGVAYEMLAIRGGIQGKDRISVLAKMGTPAVALAMTLETATTPVILTTGFGDPLAQVRRIPWFSFLLSKMKPSESKGLSTRRDSSSQA